MTDPFKDAVLAPTPTPYDPAAKHTLGEKIAHAVEVAKTAVVNAEHAVMDLVSEVLDALPIPGASSMPAVAANDIPERQVFKIDIGMDPIDPAALGEIVAEITTRAIPAIAPVILTHFADEPVKHDADTDAVMAKVINITAAADKAEMPSSN